MVKEDFKEISKEHLISAKYLVKFKGDCFKAEIDCKVCPFRPKNTDKYNCYQYSNEEQLLVAKKFVKTFGGKK